MISALANRNLMRVIRRRLGLSQTELAYVLGRTQSYVSMIEDGSRVPQLVEVLIIELVFGVPAVAIFPQIRRAVGQSVGHRVRILTARVTAQGHPRRSYKTAQLERVTASLRIRDGENDGGFETWKA